VASFELASLSGTGCAARCYRSFTSVQDLDYTTLTMKDVRAILKELKKLEEKRRALMDALLRTEELAVGTLRKAKRPCGNPRCGKCAQGPSHEQVVLYYTTEKGKRTSRFVRRSDEARFEEASGRYHEFREVLREFKRLNLEELDLLGVLRERRSITRKA